MRICCAGVRDPRPRRPLARWAPATTPCRWCSFVGPSREFSLRAVVGRPPPRGGSTARVGTAWSARLSGRARRECATAFSPMTPHDWMPAKAQSDDRDCGRFRRALPTSRHPTQLRRAVNIRRWPGGYLSGRAAPSQLTDAVHVQMRAARDGEPGPMRLRGNRNNLHQPRSGPRRTAGHRPRIESGPPWRRTSNPTSQQSGCGRDVGHEGRGRY